MANKAIGLLTFNFGANMSGFTRSLNKAEKSLNKFSRNTQRIGRNLTTSLTLPLAGIGFASVKAFDAQEKALAQVEAGIKSTGNAAGFTSEQFQKMASELQSVTIFGDEEILGGVTAQLLTFTNITEEQFARTQVAALDLATRLDGDLKSASIQLGKALNDPIANLSALSRSGIQFSDDQKQLINTLAETGRLAEAQTIILDELEKQYGGSAEAAANAGLGPITQLKNTISDLSEEIGEILMPFLHKLANGVKNIAERFTNLSKPVKNFIVILGVVLASIGPILIILGKFALLLGMVFLSVKSLISVVKLLIPVLTALFRLMFMNPFGLIVTGLAAVVLAFRYVTKSGDKLAVNIRNAFRAVANYAIDGINALIRAGNKVAGVFGKTVDEIKHFEMESYSSSASSSDTADNVDDLSNSLENLDGNIIDTTEDVEDLDNKITNLGGSTDKTTDKLKKLENISLDLKTENLVPDISSGPTSAVGEMFSIPESVESDWDVFMNHLEFSFAKLGENLEAIWEDVMGGFKASLNSFTEFFGAQSNKQMTIFKNNKKEELDTLEKQQEIEREALEDTIVDEEELNKALKALDIIHADDKKAMTDRLDEDEKKIKTKQAKREKAMGILNATISTVEAVMAAIAMSPATGGLPWSALVAAAGAANVATIASTPIPAFAQGGLITGATVGLIGEGIGTTAANPEVVAPLDKLKQFMGGDRIEVVGRLVGNDIYLSNKKTEFNRLRTT